MPIIQLTQTLLLAGIAVLMSMPLWYSDSASTTTPDSRAVDHEVELRKLAENTFASRFKYPDSVKFPQANFHVERLLADNGFKASDEQEIFQGHLCGTYTAQTAMGMAGQPQKFYGTVAVNNSTQTLAAKFYYQNEGDIKVSLMSYPSPYDVSAPNDDERAFDEAWKTYCKGINKIDRGIYNDYTATSSTILVEAIPRKLIESTLENEAAKTHAQHCLDNKGNPETCMQLASCMTSEKENAACETMLNECKFTDDLDDCHAKIDTATDNAETASPAP